MTDEKMKSTKLRTLISSLIFSIILMVFPALSGAIVVINSYLMPIIATIMPIDESKL